MKGNTFSILQRIGRSFMLPIAILPIAGLFLGIGSSFTNQTIIETYHLTNLLGKGTILYSILSVMSFAGGVVFNNLPIIFAMGVAIGMAKQEKGVAALSGAIAFFIMHTAISTLLILNGQVTPLSDGGFTSTLQSGTVASIVGIPTLQMGVFGGIIVGLGVAALHNKFYNIKLPTVLSFFGGTRFIPIISSILYLFIDVLMYYIWPTAQTLIYSLGDIVRNSGYFGTFFYGLMERSLIPFGLHHVFYLPFWQTGVGGTLEIGGKIIEGAQNIFFAQLADPTTKMFSVEATRFMSGKFPLMIFGLPGVALAMYHTSKPEKRKVVGGLLLSAALTAMITGITEPIEYTFLFAAPILYVIHSILAGLAYMLMHIFKVGVGMTFSGGLIDLTLYGILQGNAKTNWVFIIPVGIFYFLIYYFLFKTIILKMNLNTPGRESDVEKTSLYTKPTITSLHHEQSLIKQIAKGLGGKNNIKDIDCCVTRLRVTVKDASLVNETLLQTTGAAGILKKGNGIQVVYGPQVTVIKSDLEDYLMKEEN